jgi:glycosyltransferase involved in cell wall biosynthesis
LRASVRVALVGTGVEPIPPTGYGGVERTIAEFARALEAAGQDVAIVQRVRRRRSIDEYLFARDLPRLLDASRFDVVHASTPVVANRLAGRGVPYVYTTHSRHWFLRRTLTDRWGLLLERRAVRRSQATVALTASLAQRIRQETAPHPPRRLPVIPIGVDPQRFQPDWSARTGRRALGVGVVAPFKRWELAARALRGTGIELALVGPTPDAAYAARVRSSGDRVSLLGELDDAALSRRYAESDLLVHPSSVELLAGVVLQGLASGLPVLGAESVAEAVEDDVTGWTVPAGSTDDTIAEFIGYRARRLAADPEMRRRMGEAARASAIARFAWPTVVRAHLELYREILGGRNPPPGTVAS